MIPGMQKVPDHQTSSIASVKPQPPK